MTNADTLFGIMASLGKTQYSVQSLVKLSEFAGITENSVRTTLHRMQKKGILSSIKDGRNAFYFFGEKGRKISRNVARGFNTPDWSGWGNEWWGILYSVPDTEKPLRYKIRTKLGLYRFASLYPGFWIRPRNPDNNIFTDLKDIKENPYCRIIRFQGEPAFSVKEIQVLWQVDQVHNDMCNALHFINCELDSAADISPETAFIKKLSVGEQMVSTLFRDPLLPDMFLPKDWKASQLRRTFLNFDRLMTQKAQPLLKKIFKEENN